MNSRKFFDILFAVIKKIIIFAKQSESGIDRNQKNLIPYVPKLIPLDFVGDIF